MPFDHIVVVMMENHSFDNLLGELSRSGQRDVDGLHFDGAGVATNSNPGPSGPARCAFPFATTAQAPHVTQTWKATHEQIDGGAMDGFVRSVGSDEPMGYYTPEVLPFAYSLASQFTVANRWFCSVPGRPTRTAGSCSPAPPTATRYRAPRACSTRRRRTARSSTASPAYGITWCDYFSDLPMTSIIPSIIQKYPGTIAPIAEFFADCAAGTLPAVSFVDPSSACCRTSARRWRRCRVPGASDRGGPRARPAATRRTPRTCTTARRGRTGDPGGAATRRPGRGRCSSTSTTSTAATTTTSRRRQRSRPTRSRRNSSPATPPGAYDVYGPRVPADRRLALRQARAR